MTKQQIKSTARLSCSGSKPVIISVLIAALTALGAALGLNSCTASRVVSTTASYVQHGDTTTTIMTKTIERYEGTRER